jgi:hypothetical protein
MHSIHCADRGLGVQTFVTKESEINILLTPVLDPDPEAIAALRRLPFRPPSRIRPCWPAAPFTLFPSPGVARDVAANCDGALAGDPPGCPVKECEEWTVGPALR